MSPIPKDYEDKPPAPCGLKWAVIACEIVGPGTIKVFGIDGKKVFDEVKWLTYCKIRSDVGLVCDGKVLAEIPFRSYWGTNELDIGNSICVQKWGLVSV